MPAGSKSKLWLNPTVAFPAVSAGVLITVFLIYYFPVTSRQEASLNNRAFRSLSAVSDQLRNRIVSYASALEQATKKLPDKTSTTDLHQAMSNYLAEQVSDLTLGDETGESGCQRGSATVSLELNNGQYFIEFACVKWRARVSLEKVLAPYLRGTPDQLFDEVALTNSAGAVLYQTGKTAYRISQMSSALSVPGSPAAPSEGKESKPAAVMFEAAGNSSNLASLPLAGEQYKVYLVPVPLKLAATSAEEKPSSHLVLCGLLRDSRFRSESMAVPGTMLVALVLLLLIVIASTSPLFKFRSLRATDYVPRRTVQYFWLSMLATIVLICILVFHALYVVDTSIVDENLRVLAADIENHLVEELTQAIAVMDSLQRNKIFTSIKDAHPSETCDNQEHVEKQLLAKKEVQLSAYPYFDRVFWSDSRGFQHIKLDTANIATSQTYVKDRPYYQGTLDNRLWSFSNPGPDATRFRVDPIFSLNTGDYLAVISRRPPSRILLCKDGTELSVESMVTPLMSLISPVMPPEYGFAVVDDDGKVLFHSNSTKNGQENFFHELQDERELRASIQARKGEFLTARYLGFDHRLFVTPMLKLPQAPWTFIVFHDLSARSAQHLERIVLFGALAMIYFVLISMALLVLPASRYPPAWLWPSEGNQSSYVRLIVAMLFIAPAFYLMIFELPLAVLPVAAFLIPVVGLSLVILKLKPMPSAVRWAALVVLVSLLLLVWGSNSQQSLGLWILFGVLIPWLPFKGPIERWFAGWSGKRSLENSFTAAFAFTLLLGGVLPSLAFFKVAYDYHEDLSVRRLQVQTLAALAEREERVKERYAKLTLSSGMVKPDGTDVGKWLFLRRRLDQTLDRYDTTFLSVSGLQLSPDNGLIGATFPRQSGPSSVWRADALPQSVSLLASLVPYGWGTLTSHLSGISTVNPTWEWLRGGSNRIRIQPANAQGLDAEGIRGSPVTTALLKSVTSDPVFLSPVLVSELAPLPQWNWKWSIAVFVVGFAITFLWIKPTIRRMFLFDSRPANPLPERSFGENTIIDHNYIVLVPHYPAVADGLRRRMDVSFIDLAAIPKEAVRDLSIPKRIVVIDHFDYHGSDVDADRYKLDLLEWLASQRPSKAVVILTMTDPSFRIEEGELGETSLKSSPAGKETERWFRALISFERVKSSVYPTEKPADRYRMQWSACTTKERVALYQLADFGWANHKNGEAFHQLELRGLVRGTPYHFVDGGLREFVLRSVSPEDRKLWSKLDSASIWDGIRLMFLVLSLGLMAAVLFFNQQSVLGWIVSGIGVLAPFTKLLSEARSFRSIFGFDKGEETA